MEEFKIEIPISGGEGESSKGSRYEKALLKQQSATVESLKGILKATAIVAAIWVALSPILTPLLKLLSLMLLVVFLPLLPYIKQIATKIGDLVVKIRDGQTGETPMEGFTGGIGALFGDWNGIGVLIAAGIIAALAGGGALMGTLAATIGFSLMWDLFGGTEEESLSEILKKSLGIGLAAAVAALAFGAGIYSLPIGILTFSIMAGLKFIDSGMKSDELKEALKMILLGSGMLGIVVGTVVGMIFGGVAGAVVAISVGTILFTVLAGLKIGKMEAAEGEGGANSISEYIDQETSKANTFWEKLAISWSNNALFKNAITEISFLIGNKEEKDSLVSNLEVAENEWNTMADVSNTAIGGIIRKLSLIPRNITTVHTIITRRRSE